MPINSQHDAFAENFPIWKKCRDVRQGEDWIKRAREIYLPMLTKQDEDDYKAYLMRASFFNATDRTVEALNGALFMKTPALTCPEGMKTILEEIGPDGESFLHIITLAGEEVITVGRIGLLVDKGNAPDSQPYLASYAPETIINWRTEMIEGKQMLSVVVLEETRSDYIKDEFVPEEETIWRVLRLEFTPESPNKRIYTQEVYREVEENNTKTGLPEKRFVSISKVVPSRKGGTYFGYIPFVFINPNSITDRVEKSPILDLVNVNLSHYRTSADLEHGRHFTALPTPVVVGAKAGTVLKVGSETAWVLPEKASATMLEFSGAGLMSLVTALKEKEQQMAVIGSRLLEPQKRDAESADAIKLRLSGEGSVLSGISDNLTIGATEILKIIADWMNYESAGCSYKVNRDFTSALLSPQDQISLMAQVQGGFLAYEEYFDIMKRARIIPEDRTLEKQKEMLQESAQFRVAQTHLDANGRPLDNRLNSDVKPPTPPAPDPAANKKD